MINIEITQAQRNDWQLSIDMLARIAECGAGLLKVNQDGALEVIVHSNISLDILNNFDTSTDLFGSYTNFTAHIDAQSQCFLPIFWPGGASFGYLYLNQGAWVTHALTEVGQAAANPQTANQTTDHRHILSTIKKSIEHDLAHRYRECKLEQSKIRKADEQVSSVGLQQFVDCLKEHVWMKDALGRYVLVNHSVELAWNRPREQILNRTDDELFEPRLANFFIATDNKAILNGIEVSAGECEGLDVDDVSSWLETTKIPVLDDSGELAGVIGMSRNISSHKAALEQLELASRVFENSVEGVVITDVEGTIIDAHGAYQGITGFNKQELVGKTIRMFSSERHDDAFFAAIWQALLSDGKWHGEIWNRCKDGAIFPLMLNVSAVYGDEHKIRFFVAAFSDISIQKQSEAQLAEVTLHDPLTKLPNRMALTTRLEQDLKQASHNQQRLALVYIDVDLFKQINESYGHSIGDEVLLELGRRFSSGLGDLAIAARLGSDEFAVLLPNIDSNDMLLLSINQLRQVFDLPFVLGEYGQARLTASMGVAIFPDDTQDSSNLLVNAEVAMHRAKREGRNNYAFYTESLTEKSVANLKLQSALHNALETDAFHLVFQPKISFKTGKVIGVETLLRWDDPLLGRISPMVFIPLAENIGLIQDIGRWVLKKACEQGQRWHQQGLEFGRIAVNVASQQLQRSSFVDEVAEILQQTGLPASSLELEVTESGMLSDPLLVSQYLARFGSMGIELSIDDFGTGYSSLSYLKKLPIHKLKIDQSFVAGLPFDTHNTAIAKAIIAMGHALNLKVVAEGVETQEQADFLIASDCDEAQGYFYSRPKLAKELTDYLSAEKPKQLS
ncbi:GGDEF domain-containing protein [Shewanella sairae]|uniref:GGDEF domain-containing protein n=1 Tax=Shewanella sairae TaxID=190310 RepID=A0ABQ4P7F4_9GAMM|nr:bifunctional diguanylate cyclase/phosphodiesterase [Shewanella sairae]MCL1128825.1 EAL domain-containing protein [Shewanella sairae]GIU43459.1 GGDEF domain-containing protein [Shewanella sairae]